MFVYNGSMRIVLLGRERRVQLRADEIDGSVTYSVWSLPATAARQRFTNGELEYHGRRASDAVATAERIARVRVPQHHIALNRALYREAQQQRAA